jgi:uncharacterized delta-60 repeat protein
MWFSNLPKLFFGFRNTYLRRRRPGRLRRHRYFRPELEVLENRLTPSTYTVTSTADSGPGTLREAILGINANPDRDAGFDTINFNIGSGGAQTIALLTALPSITSPVTIDGTAQPGYAGSPLIELDGSSTSSGISGLTITGGSSEVLGLAIDNFSGDGIDLLTNSGNRVHDNSISANGGNGVFISGAFVGTIPIGSSNVVQDNSINSNGGNGVFISGPAAGRPTGGSNKLQGNSIGQNFGDGVLIQGAADGNQIVGANIISDNFANGIEIIASSSNVVQGNSISANVYGYGVLINGAARNGIGGTASGQANTISSNGKAGVAVIGNRIGNAIRGNSIFSNGNSFFSNGPIGIDLGADGVTPNHTGSVVGPNNFQNFPVLTPESTTSIVTGTLNGLPDTTYTIDFYRNDVPGLDPSGHGEGHFYLGSTTVTTDGSGNASVSFDTGSTVAEYVTATATDPAGNTSEFSGVAQTFFFPVQDTTFGNFGGGIAQNPFINSFASDLTNVHMALEGDGSIVVEGTSIPSSLNDTGPFGGGDNKIVVARFTADGLPDFSFGNFGYPVITDINLVAGFSVGGPYQSAVGIGLAIEPFGDKIVVAASDNYSDNIFLKYNSDGSLDTSFGVTQTFGKASGGYFGGLSVIGGASVFGSGFNIFSDRVVPDSLVTLPGENLIAVAGHSETFTGTQFTVTSTYILLLEDNGFYQVAPSVLSGGAIIPNALAVDRSSTVLGTLILTGFAPDNPAELTVAFGNPQITFSGFSLSADALSFGFNGTTLGQASAAAASAIAIAPDGSVTIAGTVQYPNGSSTVSDVFVARLTDVGGVLDLDPSFVGGGPNVIPIQPGLLVMQIDGLSQVANGLTIQQDGKIVLAVAVTAAPTIPTLESSLVLLRYNSDGSLDNHFGFGGQATTPFSATGSGVGEISGYGNTDAVAVAVQPSGRIVVAGTATATALDYPISQVVLAGYLGFDPAPVVTGLSGTVVAETPFDGAVASFTDPDPAGTADDYTATIDWGDGQSSAGTIAPTGFGGFEVSGTHTYAAEGVYHPAVTISDADTITPTTATATITVSAPTLQKLNVTPADPTVAEGLTQQFTVTGSFSDGSQQDETNTVAWSSDTPAVATISSSGGLASAVSTGTTRITAALAGISGATTLTVVNAAAIATNASQVGKVVGSAVLSDSATLSDGVMVGAGGATITFSLTAPDGTTTAFAPITVTGDGIYPSPTVTATEVGTYTWHASYSGNSFNNGVTDDGSNESLSTIKASPSLVTTASPGVTLDTSGAPTISDTIVMSGAYFPTGNVDVALMLGSMTVFTDSFAAANGPVTENYTLPMSGTVTGTYTWSVSYAGDANNNKAGDESGTAEQTVVNPANPTLVTTASPDGIVTLGTSTMTLSDSADLEGGYNPTGRITFTLTYNSSPVYSSSVSVSGDGVYDSARYTLPTTGTVTSLYVWTANYRGDGNNKPVGDNGSSPTKQVGVKPANPALVTTASPPVTLGTTSDTISDTATLSGGYFPSGSINFTLMLGSTTVYTTSAPVSGNGSYSAGYPLPTSGTVTGTYTWSASYTGDGNNLSANDQGGAAEQSVVSKATPTIVTTSSATGTVNVGTTAITVSDSAVVSGGYYETGSLLFTLTGPNGFSFTTTDTLNGNNMYTASTTIPASAAAGTYTWTVSYAGDANNNPNHDQGGSAEQFTLQNVATAGEAATKGFWANNNGQALLKSYTTSAIGNWLATTYPNLFGNLSGATGSQVGTYYLTLKGASGQTNTTMANVMSTALSVWVTTTGLGWNTSSTGPTFYGFHQGFSGVGLGSLLYYVGSNGASFGVANNTYLTVNEILAYFNSHTVRTGGTLTKLPTWMIYAGNASLLNRANAVFGGINQTGDIV